jgi:hypothetical protein
MYGYLKKAYSKASFAVSSTFAAVDAVRDSLIALEVPLTARETPSSNSF